MFIDPHLPPIFPCGVQTLRSCQRASAEEVARLPELLDDGFHVAARTPSVLPGTKTHKMEHEAINW